MKYFVKLDYLQDSEIVSGVGNFVEGQSTEVTSEVYEKIKKLIQSKPKEKKLKPLYTELADLDDVDVDEFMEDGEIDEDMVADMLHSNDCVMWNDRTGEKDNALPFRVWINEKYLIEFSVEQGDCIEATWDHRIWEAHAVGIKLIETK